VFYLQRGQVPHKRHTQFRKPDGGLYAQRGEGVSRHPRAVESLRLADASHIVAATVVNADMFKGRLLRTPVDEIRVGDRHRREIQPALAEPHQPPGFRVW